MKIIKKLLIIIPVVCGIIFLAVMKMNKKPPVRQENRERVQAVRVITMEKMPVIPQVSAFGHVVADRVWQAIPEVSGKVVWMNENLKKGYFLKKGETLLQIDTTSYGLAESRGVADLMSVDAQLKELEQSEKNTRRLLEIEKKSLASASQELKRKRQLFENGYISASDLEREERTFLAHQTTVNNLQNALDLIPSQKKALLAQKKSGESAVTERRLDVKKTRINAPFDCRVSSVSAELHQFAAAGSVLAQAQSMDRVEIPVALTPSSFFALVPKNSDFKLGVHPDVEAIRRAIGLDALVRLPLTEDRAIEWKGAFSRTSESMDEKTGALTVYVTVDNPYGGVVPGMRPPLVTHMYVEVILKGRPLPDRFVVPCNAVHDNRIYICKPDNRLEIRAIKIEARFMDMAVLSKGVETGEKLVLTDIVPAVDGMLLKPVPDPEVKKKLEQKAAGRNE